VLNQFANTPAGVIVAGGVQPKSKGGSLNLYRMTNGQCTTANVLVAEPANGDAADFSVSPDGKTIALSSTHGQAIPDGGATPQHDIFVLPADGTSPLVKLAGDPLADDIGPRWVAGGRQLVWTQGSLLADGGLKGGGLLIANADGTHVRSLAPEVDGQGMKVVIIGGTNSGVSCSWVGAMSGGFGASALVALGLLLLLLRRRST
jgi:Tol biopolymer transport system component